MRFETVVSELSQSDEAVISAHISWLLLVSGNTKNFKIKICHGWYGFFILSQQGHKLLHHGFTLLLISVGAWGGLIGIAISFKFARRPGFLLQDNSEEL